MCISSGVSSPATTERYQKERRNILALGAERMHAGVPACTTAVTSSTSAALYVRSEM